MRRVPPAEPDYAVKAAPPKVGEVDVNFIAKGSHEYLPVVNTNNSRAVTFTTPASMFPTGHSGSRWN